MKRRALTTLVTISAASIASGATFTWTGGPGNWTDPAKWGGSVPPAGSDILIDGGNAAASNVAFNTSVSLATLTINANDLLTFTGSNRSLTITGGTILNDGQFILADPGAGVHTLGIAGVVALAGAGDFIMGSAGDNQIIPTVNGATDRIVVGVNQLVTTTPDATFASAFIVRLDNDGTVEANVGDLLIAGHSPKTNRNLMRATDGGTLRFQNITLDNLLGEIEAGVDSEISYDGVTLVGGELSGTGVHDVETGDLTLQGTTNPVTIAANARLQMLGASSRLTRLEGAIVNNGTILMEDTGSGINQILIANTVDLSGSGRLELRGVEHNQIDPIINGATDMLNIGASQTLAALGGTTILSTINARFTNNGVIDADAGTLNIAGNSPKENNNLIRARNGGDVRMASVVVENTAATIQADAASTVTYEGVTISGGSLSGTGQHVVGTSDLTLNGTPNAVTLGTGSTLAMIGASSRFTRLQGSIVNNGTIILEDTGSGINQMLIADPVSLSGAGTILLRGTENNQIDPIINGVTDVLTLGANQTFTTSSETTLSSVINARFVNNGVIEANEGDLQIAGNSPKENNALIRSRNAGNLQFTNVSVDNVDGTIEASASSTIAYEGAVITGGALAGAGTHVVGTGDLTLVGASNPVTIAEDATVELIGASSRALRLEGSIVHNGEIVVQDTGSGVNQILIPNIVTMTGTGTIRLAGILDNQIIAIINGNSDVLSLGPDNSVVATGTSLASGIQVRFANAGLIDADAGQLDILGNTPKHNTGLIRARNGGGLRISAVTVDNTGGEIEVESGSSLSLTSATINGGDMSVTGGITTSGTNNLGVTLRPAGGVPGTISITGPSPVLGASNVIDLDLGGATPGTQHDVINFSAQSRFGGTLRVRAVNGFVPAIGDRFVIANYPSHLAAARFTDFQSIGFPGLLTVRVDYQATRAELVIVRVGDINCDGQISVSDIAPMVLALTQPDQFPIQFPNCEFFDADINGDGVISVADIAPFVAMLTGG